MNRIILLGLLNLALAILLEGRSYSERYNTREVTTTPVGVASSYEIPNIATLSPIDFDAINIDTNGWDTYTDSNVEYSFKYSTSTEVEEAQPPRGIQSSVSILNLPLHTDYDGNIDGVTITCCMAANKSIADLNSILATSTSRSSVQVLRINGNKVLVENSNDDNGQVTSVVIYLIAKNKVFTFYTDSIDGYNRGNYETAVGIINTFRVK